MSRTGPSELQPLVNQFEHLSDKRRAAEALERLRKIASIVKPLMRQRSWHVYTLAEFYPSEHNLLGLNINKGMKICLRLRYPGDDTQFLPIENVVDTMLHELAHIVHGPHDQHFHALWDKLRDEHEALIRKGYTGEGFLGKGNMVGGRYVPIQEAKRKARVAAERRKVLNKGSGQKLGGLGIMRGQNPREIIAAAAEKRMRIERGCASATSEGERIAQAEEIKKEKVTRTAVEKEDENEAALMQVYIDLIQEEESQQFGDNYLPPNQANPAGMKGTSSPPGLRTSLIGDVNPETLLQEQQDIEQNLRRNRDSETQRPKPPPSITPLPSAPKHDPSPEPRPDTWTCEICTLVNPLQLAACDACTAERPAIYGFTPPAPSAPPAQRTQSSSRTSTRENPNALKPHLNAADSIKRLEEQAAYKKALPIGWPCLCGNYMEMQWWTCSVCGRMKASS